MMQIVLIGIGAGAAAALLFASVTLGLAGCRSSLFYLAPLPIMIAGHRLEPLGGIDRALGRRRSRSARCSAAMFFLRFSPAPALPAWWLGYLAMLARPAGNGARHAAALEWYPPGRLVMWAALLGALVVIAAIPNFGIDGESFRAALQRALSQLLRAGCGAPMRRSVLPGVADPKRLIDFLVAAIPPAAAVLATIANLFNLGSPAAS